MAAFSFCDWVWGHPILWTVSWIRLTRSPPRRSPHPQDTQPISYLTVSQHPVISTGHLASLLFLWPMALRSKEGRGGISAPARLGSWLEKGCFLAWCLLLLPLAQNNSPGMLGLCQVSQTVAATPGDFLLGFSWSACIIHRMSPGLQPRESPQFRTSQTREKQPPPGPRPWDRECLCLRFLGMLYLPVWQTPDDRQWPGGKWLGEAG